MAETSQKITITLGRTGQVVKRSLLEEDPVPVSKPSVRDRLGGTHTHKRPRGDDATWNLKDNHFVDDLHLSKDDLRFKIMKRTKTTVDLRDMLSRRPRPSTLHEPRQITPTRIPGPKDMPDSRNIRHIPRPGNERHHMLDQLDDRHRIPESRDDTRRIPEPLEVRHHISKPNHTRQHIPDPTNGSMTRHFTSMRTSEGPSQMDFLRNSYSPWTLDHIRRKSPDLNSSRGLSPPPPRTDETQRRPVITPYEAPPKSVTYASRDVSEIPRPMTTASFMTKPSISVGPTKSVGPLVTAPLPSAGSMQRSQYPVAENLTVEGFLRSLGLEKYLISFKVEEVDMAALSQMGDHDLKEMGIPMGPRKKIILALLARARGQGR